MKIILNTEFLYSLMNDKKIRTIMHLSHKSGISHHLLYSAIDRNVASKETYWRLAKFFGCHVEELQIFQEK